MHMVSLDELDMNNTHLHIYKYIYIQIIWRLKAFMNEQTNE